MRVPNTNDPMTLEDVQWSPTNTDEFEVPNDLLAGWSEQLVEWGGVGRC